MAALLKRWARYLLFLATREELATLSWREFLGPALIATWVAGMGRYWDHPSAHPLQMSGMGSLTVLAFYSAVPLLIAYLLLVRRSSRVPEGVE